VPRFVARTVGGGQQDLVVDRNPDQCPLCHRSVDAVFEYGTVWQAQGTSHATIVFRCPSADCENLFLAKYEPDDRPGPYGGGAMLLQNFEPQTVGEINIDEDIRALSPRYAELLAQAVAAEAYGLSELVGMGLRKALGEAGPVCEAVAGFVREHGTAYQRDRAVPRPPDAAHVRLSVVGAGRQSRRPSANPGSRLNRDHAAVRAVE